MTAEEFLQRCENASKNMIAALDKAKADYIEDVGKIEAEAKEAGISDSVQRAAGIMMMAAMEEYRNDR